MSSLGYSVLFVVFFALTLGVRFWLANRHIGVVLIGFTLLGGLQALSVSLLGLTGPGLAHQMALVVAFAVVSGLLDLPFDW